MHSEEKVILVGAFRESVELCEDAGLSLAGCFDLSSEQSFSGYPILGSDEDAKIRADIWCSVPVIIALDQPAARMRLVPAYQSWGYRVRGMVSPQAVISRSAKVGLALVAQRNVNISADVKIGDHVRLNTMCNLMHDVVIGDFCTIAPNAVLLGRVQVGAGAYIGANSTILPDRRIGEGAVVGAGAVVTRDVAPGVTVTGSPARALR